MIKILNFNRKVRSEAIEDSIPVSERVLRITDANCNVVIATDHHYNKGHFTLTEAESDELERLAQKVEARLVNDIGDLYAGLDALEQLPATTAPTQEQSSAATA